MTAPFNLIQLGSRRSVLKVVLGVLCAGLLCFGTPANAQQFVGDNQWVAPYGVSTIAGSVGEEYSQLYLISALVPEWEFNLQLTRYEDDVVNDTESYTSTNLFAKRRLYESENGNTGYSVVFGTGQFPEHLEQGEVTDAFETWWAVGTATYGWKNDRVLLDVMPGFTLDTKHGETESTAWGFTYASRLAIYDVIPQSALVGEVFGTAGEAYAKPSYRVGVRWESKKLVIAATYSDAFDGSGGAGFELGFIYFTEPRLCWGGCRR